MTANILRYSYSHRESATVMVDLIQTNLPHPTTVPYNAASIV